MATWLATLISATDRWPLQKTPIEVDVSVTKRLDSVRTAVQHSCGEA
jgi:hypothetical protein